MMRIDVQENGPLIVKGGVPLLILNVETGESGVAVDYREIYRYPLQEAYALCRCGASEHKPFCDNAHVVSGFDGTETEGHHDFAADAQAVAGAGITLLDAKRYCMGALFCHQDRGTWEETRRSVDAGHAGADAAASARHSAAQCPSSRLMMWVDDLGAVDEPELEPSIALLEGPHEGSSAVWVRGGIPIFGADGQPYEKRNRVTLCRCGHSHLKPYCDRTHCEVCFADKLDDLA